jgi:hypothetical protein
MNQDRSHLRLLVDISFMEKARKEEALLEIEIFQEQVALWYPRLISARATLHDCVEIMRKAIAENIFISPQTMDNLESRLTHQQQTVVVLREDLITLNLMLQNSHCNLQLAVTGEAKAMVDILVLNAEINLL